MQGIVIDEANLASWLASQLPVGRDDLVVTPLLGGSSNRLYHLAYAAGPNYVLRCPPREKYDPTSHNVSREITLLSALGKTDLPHPRLIASCSDTTVIGVPFLIIAFVDGFSPVGRFPEPFESSNSHRCKIGFAMVEALAALAKLPWSVIGLKDFGKPDGFLQRQVDRWMSQLARYQSREIPYLDRLAEWLEQNRPSQQHTALMHGDYSFPNVMIARQSPVRMAAIVDWESATIGDPLLDLGHLLAGWCDPGESRTYLRDVDWRGMPTRRELVSRYAELTGFDPANIEYYKSLALFKLAIILEGAYARYLKGQSDYEPHRTLEQRVPHFIEQAWGFAQAS
jgi:aminoglycoside phosphotransferase (APT) family kinase protein